MEIAGGRGLHLRCVSPRHFAGAVGGADSFGSGGRRCRDGGAQRVEALGLGSRAAARRHPPGLTPLAFASLRAGLTACAYLPAPTARACASSDVRRDGGGGKRDALPGLCDSARAPPSLRAPTYGRRLRASSDVRRDEGGGRRSTLPGLLDSARLRLAARASLTARACALHPTYASMKAERDGALFPGCLTPLAFASLRLAARADLRSALARFPQRTPGWRRRATERLTRAV